METLKESNCVFMWEQRFSKVSLSSGRTWDSFLEKLIPAETVNDTVWQDCELVFFTLKKNNSFFLIHGNKVIC